MSKRVKTLLLIVFYPLYGGWIAFLIGNTLAPFLDKDTGMVGVFYALAMWPITVCVSVIIYKRLKHKNNQTKLNISKEGLGSNKI